MIRNIKYLFSLLICLFTSFSFAADLADIQVTNGRQQSTITLSFHQQPIYGFFPLHNPERVVLDVRRSGSVQGLPLSFDGQNLIKRIRTSQPKDEQSIRLVFELNQPGKTRAVTQKNGNQYQVVFTVSATGSVGSVGSVGSAGSSVGTSEAVAEVSHAGGSAKQNPFKPKKAVDNSQKTSVVRSDLASTVASDKVTVAIDAGHGGQDPGAIGQNGQKEKNVTIAVARKLQQKLNADPMFRGVLTRDGDYFISVMGRSEVARKQNAHLLVSIHADAAPNRGARGASVWVLSNRRANSEMANWLEQHEKQSELLGGAGDLLANEQVDPYLSQAVLDLQFGHSQRVGYDVALKVLAQLQGVGYLHKRNPAHASLGVLRSPDIPSVLIETGFISNPSEEQLLGSHEYQEKLAESIHKGLRAYFLANPFQSAPAKGKKSSAATTSTDGVRHIVSKGETLSGIASRYGVTSQAIKQANTMQSTSVTSGQSLIIP